MILKSKPQDFIVKEISKVNTLFNNNGKYSYYKLKKTNLTTMLAIKFICFKLKLNKKDINYAGIKDKRAVTEQYISILNGKDISYSEYGSHNNEEWKYELDFIGKGNNRLTLGELEGNYFEIIVREVEDKNIPKKFVNYFDIQRFGVENKNHILGKLLVKKMFKEFCEELELEVERNDFVRAIKSLDRRLLLLYLHAYQSFLFNEIASTYVNNDLSLNNDSIGSNISLPLIGFSTEIEDDNINKIVNMVMKKENVDFRDFIIPQLDRLTLEGGMRKLFIDIKDLNIEEIDFDTYKCTFTLPKGCYATMVMKQIFS